MVEVVEAMVVIVMQTPAAPNTEQQFRWMCKSCLRLKLSPSVSTLRSTYKSPESRIPSAPWPAVVSLGPVQPPPPTDTGQGRSYTRSPQNSKYPRAIAGRAAQMRAAPSENPIITPSFANHCLGTPSQSSIGDRIESGCTRFKAPKISTTVARYGDWAGGGALASVGPVAVESM